MNIQEFLDLHLTGDINFAGGVNVLYQDDADGETGTIIAMSVTQNALSYNNSEDLDDTDIYNILINAESIGFTYDDDNYVAEISDFDYYQIDPTTGGFSFFIFQFSSVTTIDDITDTDLDFAIENWAGSNLLVNFTPSISLGIFSISDYNPLINNGNLLRRSSLRLEVDREIGSLQAASAVPSNFEAILSTSASKAQVQDSFYTDTGLTNARYNGTKATPKTFANIKPALSANEFIGDIHPIDSNLEIVCLYNNNDRVNQPLLHTNPARIPAFTTGSIYIKTDGIITPVINVINYDFMPGFNFALQIDPNDILFFKHDGGTLADYERVRVLEHNAFTKRIVVEREFLSSTAQNPLDEETEIAKIIRTDIYKIDDFIRNLSAVENAMIYEKETHSVLFTDPFGLVFSQSLCPEVVDTSVDDAGSDRRLKTNINLIGKSPSNINIYSFEYRDKDKFGYGTYQGVMSDEVIKEAVTLGVDGYDRVNYSLLDVEFKKLKD